MAGFSNLWNQNAVSRVTLSDTFCKETASCLINIAHPSVIRPLPNPATPDSSLAALSSRLRCCFGSCLAKAPQLQLTTMLAVRPILSPLKHPRRHLLIRSHLLRLTQLRLLRLTRLRLRPLTRHLPPLRQPQPTRNAAGLRACTDLSILGGHRAVFALFSFPQTVPAAAAKLPTGMTLC